MNAHVELICQEIAKRQHKSFASPSLHSKEGDIQHFISTCDSQNLNQVVSIDLAHKVGLVIITDGTFAHVISFFTSLLKTRAGQFHDVCGQSIAEVGCATSATDCLRSLQIEACVLFAPDTLNLTAAFAQPIEIGSESEVRCYLALFVDQRAYRYHALGFEIFLEYMKAFKPDFLSLRPRALDD